jgi:hypothetical protein
MADGERRETSRMAEEPRAAVREDMRPTTPAAASRLQCQTCPWPVSSWRTASRRPVTNNGRTAMRVLAPRWLDHPETTVPLLRGRRRARGGRHHSRSGQAGGGRGTSLRKANRLGWASRGRQSACGARRGRGRRVPFGTATAAASGRSSRSRYGTGRAAAEVVSGPALSPIRSWTGTARGALSAAPPRGLASTGPRASCPPDSPRCRLREGLARASADGKRAC